jgi:hypothetical protein
MKAPNPDNKYFKWFGWVFWGALFLYLLRMIAKFSSMY